MALLCKDVVVKQHTHFLLLIWSMSSNERITCLLVDIVSDGDPLVSFPSFSSPPGMAQGLLKLFGLNMDKLNGSSQVFDKETGAVEMLNPV